MRQQLKALLFMAGLLCASAHAVTNPSSPYPLYAKAAQLYSNVAPYDLTQETYTFSILWSTPVQEDLNFLTPSYHNPIATRGDDTFVLFVDMDHRMKIAHLTNGVFKGETFVDNTLYQPDEFYDGIDENGSTLSRNRIERRTIIK